MFAFFKRLGKKIKSHNILDMRKLYEVQISVFISKFFWEVAIRMLLCIVWLLSHYGTELSNCV